MDVKAKKSAALAKPRGWDRPVPDINKIIRKAEDGDKEAFAEVKEMLERAGTVDVLGGNVAREALQRLVKSACGDNPVIREATDRKFDQMRADLLGPNPTALERLLVERIVATWYHLHHLEAGEFRRVGIRHAVQWRWRREEAHPMEPLSRSARRRPF